MVKCWCRHPEGRPSFRHLKELLLTVSQKLLIDWLVTLVCNNTTTKSKPSTSTSSNNSCEFCCNYELSWAGVCQTLCREAARNKTKRSVWEDRKFLFEDWISRRQQQKFGDFFSNFIEIRNVMKWILCVFIFKFCDIQLMCKRIVKSIKPVVCVDAERRKKKRQ